MNFLSDDTMVCHEANHVVAVYSNKPTFNGCIVACDDSQCISTPKGNALPAKGVDREQHVTFIQKRVKLLWFKLVRPQ